MRQIRASNVGRRLAPAPITATRVSFLAIVILLTIGERLPAQANLFPEASAPAPIRAVPVSARLGFSPQTPHPAVVRVISPERNSASLGSGTLVDVSDRHGLVITNWHVVKDAAGNVIVSFPDGFQTPGYVIKMDRDWDLAAVAIWRPQMQPIPLAAEIPRRGEPLTIAGYGSGTYRAQSGRCTQYLSPGAGLPYDIVEVSAAARHGDSGGPIFNARGELAGVLFGEGGGMTSGSASARVRMFLASIGYGKPAPPPPTEFASTGRDDQGVAQVAQSEDQAAPPWHAGVSQQVAAADASSRGNFLVAVPAPSANSTAPGYPSTYAPPPTWPLPPSPTRVPSGAATSGPITTLPRPAVAAAILAPEADPQSTAQQISWEDLAGHTVGQQIKTLLAALGVLMLLYQLSRRIA